MNDPKAPKPLSLDDEAPAPSKARPTGPPKPLSLDPDPPSEIEQRGRRTAVIILSVALLVVLIVLGVAIRRTLRGEEKEQDSSEGNTPLRSHDSSKPITERIIPPADWTGRNARVSLDPSVDGKELVFVICVDSIDKPFTYHAWRWSAGVTGDDGDSLEITNDRLVDTLVRAEWNSRPTSKTFTYGSGRVSFKRGRGEVITCPVPARWIKYVDVDLDATNVGERGTIQFRIPRCW